MVADIIISIAGPAVGGMIAAVAGWWVTKRDREREREARKKQWYISLSRLSQELNTTPSTVEFMKLGTDKQRQIQQFGQIANQLDQERYRAPADANSELIASLANTATNARRLDLDRSGLRMKMDHYKMLMFSEEIQYYVQNELGDDIPAKFDQERMNRVEERITTRKEMDREEWQKKEMEDMVDKWTEDSAKIAETWELS